MTEGDAITELAFYNTGHDNNAEIIGPGCRA